MYMHAIGRCQGARAVCDQTLARVGHSHFGFSRGLADRVRTDAQIRKLEADNIRAALKATSGKVSGPGGAAQLLGLKPTTLASRIKALGVRPQGARDGKRFRRANQSEGSGRIVPYTPTRAPL